MALIVSVSSGTVTTDSTAVSFIKMIAMLTDAGSTSIVISGSRMRRMICARLRPTHSAASTWPRGTASKPAAENLAEIGRAVDREPEQTRRDRVERQAGVGAAEIEQEQLDEERRAAKHLDIGAEREIEPSRPVAAADRDEKAQRASADEPDDPGEQRDPERVEDLRQLARDQGVIESHARPQFQRRSAAVPAKASARLMMK